MMLAMRLTLGALILVPGTAWADDTDTADGRNAAGQPITNPADPGYDPDLKVCRMEDRTGSRAKRREVCLKNSEWQRVARDGNRFARALVASAASGGSLTY